MGKRKRVKIYRDVFSGWRGRKGGWRAWREGGWRAWREGWVRGLEGR